MFGERFCKSTLAFYRLFGAQMGSGYKELAFTPQFLDKPYDQEWNFASTEEFTELSAKYANYIVVYTFRKIRIFLRAFLNVVCRIPEQQKPFRLRSARPNMVTMGTAEFTLTQGFPHFQAIAKLSNILNNAVLGRLGNLVRLVCAQMKWGKTRASKKEAAWVGYYSM